MLSKRYAAALNLIQCIILTDMCDCVNYKPQQT